MTHASLAHQAATARSRLLRSVGDVGRAFLRRRRLHRLRDLDDHILEDIGVTRAEVEIATRLPFTHNAARELRRLAEDRRRRLARGLDR